jgi:hypothetical protein
VDRYKLPHGEEVAGVQIKVPGEEQPTDAGDAVREALSDTRPPPAFTPTAWPAHVVEFAGGPCAFFTEDDLEAARVDG